MQDDSNNRFGIRELETALDSARRAGIVSRYLRSSPLADENLLWFDLLTHLRRSLGIKDSTGLEKNPVDFFGT